MPAITNFNPFQFIYSLPKSLGFTVNQQTIKNLAITLLFITCELAIAESTESNISQSRSFDECLQICMRNSTLYSGNNIMVLSARCNQICKNHFKLDR
jgi:hypothetical protein